MAFFPSATRKSSGHVTLMTASGEVRRSRAEQDAEIKCQRKSPEARAIGRSYKQTETTWHGIAIVLYAPLVIPRRKTSHSRKKSACKDGLPLISSIRAIIHNYRFIYSPCGAGTGLIGWAMNAGQKCVVRPRDWRASPAA